MFLQASRHLGSVLLSRAVGETLSCSGIEGSYTMAVPDLPSWLCGRALYTPSQARKFVYAVDIPRFIWPEEMIAVYT